MAQKYWDIAPRARHAHLRSYKGMSPLVAQVLYNRGFTEPERAYNFLYANDPSSGQLLSFKGKKQPIDNALARIRRAIKSGEPIVVYGDFDADGVTSTALLVLALKTLGANVKPYIPHRVDEGYGLNREALLKIARAGYKLVITVDCGIRSVEEVEDGKACGLDIIVTDHHSLGPELPNALSVINPKCDDCGYTEDMLAGVGVAYRLAEALLTTVGQVSLNRQNGKPRLEPHDLLDLVAIGTVADLAPLDRPENRALVRRGLEVINEAKRPGIRALLEVASLRSGSVTAMNIGFALGPRINAAGRLESAMTAYQLLVTEDEREALQLAQKLHSLNTQRQELTRAAQDVIRSRLEADGLLDAPLIFAGDRHFQPGIVGLVAGRLTEEFYRPAVVMEEGDEESRASCRSIPEFDITAALDKRADLLVRHGGHAQAAGFTVRNENIPALKEHLVEMARQAAEGQEWQPRLEIDAEVSPESLSLDLADELRLLEPTGHRNSLPIFVTRGLRVIDVRTVGRDDRHLKLRFARIGQPPLDAIGFNMADFRPKEGECVDVAYQLDVNEWNDARTVQLRMEDIRPAKYDTMTGEAVQAEYGD
jgi:single-stranded-DNA-specific exonuclease